MTTLSIPFSSIPRFRYRSIDRGDTPFKSRGTNRIHVFPFSVLLSEFPPTLSLERIKIILFVFFSRVRRTRARGQRAGRDGDERRRGGPLAYIIDRWPARPTTSSPCQNGCDIRARDIPLSPSLRPGPRNSTENRRRRRRREEKKRRGWREENNLSRSRRSL